MRAVRLRAAKGAPDGSNPAPVHPGDFGHSQNGTDESARGPARDQGTRGVETELIDIARLPLPTDDAGEAIKNPDFSAKMDRADALVIISPEYNHGYSGLLKHVLDSCLKEYIHKAVGIAGVSAGPFGGAGDSKSVGGDARAGSGHYLLGCEFLHCAESVR
jgi:multimeric flavodoxin WrbA